MKAKLTAEKERLLKWDEKKRIKTKEKVGVYKIKRKKVLKK